MHHDPNDIQPLLLRFWAREGSVLSGNLNGISQKQQHSVFHRGGICVCAYDFSMSPFMTMIVLMMLLPFVCPQTCGSGQTKGPSVTLLRTLVIIAMYNHHQLYTELLHISAFLSQKSLRTSEFQSLSLSESKSRDPPLVRLPFSSAHRGPPLPVSPIPRHPRASPRCQVPMHGTSMRDIHSSRHTRKKRCCAVLAMLRCSRGVAGGFGSQDCPIATNDQNMLHFIICRSADQAVLMLRSLLLIFCALLRPRVVAWPIGCLLHTCRVLLPLAILNSFDAHAV